MLNAFRHHRLLRCNRKPPHLSGVVLNAFRHHRLLRMIVERIAWGEPKLKCSTPFGITDYCASTSASRTILIVSVLNAFRHHRLLRWRKLMPSAISALVCSTPFGITDYCAEGWL